MTRIFDFCVEGPRISQLASNRSKERWKAKVRNAAAAQWPPGKAPYEYEAAVLIGWAAAEGAMRRVADAESVPISSAIAVVKELYSRGLLEPDEYKSVEAFRRLRSDIAHGFAAPRLNAVDLSRYL